MNGALMKKLRILVTGGTLDKVHDTHSEGLGFSPDGVSHVPEMLKFARCYFPKVQVLMQKDSLDFVEADLALIADAVRSADETAVVISHGTGTMGESARYLAKRLGADAGGKTVVLTGAMRPFSLHRSDADFNLGGAVIAAQSLASGVWGVMNGRIFPASDLRKNVEAGRFDIL